MIHIVVDFFKRVMRMPIILVTSKVLSVIATIIGTVFSGLKYFQQTHVTQDISMVDSVFESVISDTLLDYESILFATQSGIDLGLPSGVIWSSCNLGATANSEIGHTFKIFGLENNKSISLLPESDNVSRFLGKDWNTPSLEDFEELINLCTWTWYENPLLQGYMITGPNGNTIFLPCQTHMEDSNSYGVKHLSYWTGTVSDLEESRLWYFKSDDKKIHKAEETSFIRKYIRPIKRNVHNSHFTISITTLIPDAEIVINDTKAGMSPIEQVFVACDTLRIRAICPGYDMIDTIVSLRSDTNNIILGNFCRNSSSGIIDSVEWVDLALPSGIKWSRSNIGAEHCYESGLFLAWADPDTTRQKYSRWRYHRKENHNEMSSDTDPVSLLISEKWHTPGVLDFQELFDHCDMKIVSIKGRHVAKFTSANHNYILLPLCGHYEKRLLVQDSIGQYWTNTGNRNNATAIFIKKDSLIIENNIRKWFGLQIRPVL